MARTNVSGSAALVFRRCQLLQLGRTTLDGLLEKLLQKWNAPATTRTGAPALRKLTGDPRFLDAQVVEQLPLRDVKAITDLGIEIHPHFSATPLRRTLSL